MSMTLQEKIDVMSAYQRGQAVQFQSGSQWKDVPDPVFNFGVLDYRVAPPEPREGYVHTDDLYPDMPINPVYPQKWVHVREIVDTGDRSAPPGGSISPQRNY